MANMIKVGMADLQIAIYPDNLTTLGLGSCIGISLYDPGIKLIGLVHIMLPYSEEIKNNKIIAKFADTGIEKLLKDMIGMNAKKSRIVAKLAGGAQMFVLSAQLDIMAIGRRNIEASREVLKKLGIPIIAEDVGGNYGRTIELYSETGILKIKTIGQGIKEI